MAKPALLWEAFDLHTGVTEDIEFTLYKADQKTQHALGLTDVVRFKLAKKAGEAPTLDLDSIAASENGSVVTIITRGEAGVTPAKVNVRFAQEDTEELTPLGDWHGFIGVVDRAEVNPIDAFKIAGRGTVTLKAPPLGDVGPT